MARHVTPSELEAMTPDGAVIEFDSAAGTAHLVHEGVEYVAEVPR